MATDNIFSDLKIVDLASFIAGPAAATILCDFGAEVIKIEPPAGEVVEKRAQDPAAAAFAQKLAEKPAGALQACKRLMRQHVRPQLEQAAKPENEEYAVRLRSSDAKEAFTAFLEKRHPTLPDKTNRLGRMIRNAMVKKVKQS
jgi:CoA-transferase family III